MTLVYKVVRKVYDRYYSVYGDEFPEYCIEYKLNQWAIPKIGKIFVYHGTEWPEYNESSNRTVLLCRAYTLEFHANVQVLKLDYTSEYIDNFWTDFNIPEDSLNSIPNIFLCNAIKPLKELSREEIKQLESIHHVDDTKIIMEM